MIYDNQDEMEHALNQQNQFNDWFYGPEIKGSYILACEHLKDKIPFVIGINELFLAFFYVEPVKLDVLTNKQDDDDLPF